MEILSDKSKKRSHDLILPDMSGIAEMIDEYSLPNVETSIRELVNKHNQYNEQVKEINKSNISRLNTLESKIEILFQDMHEIRNIFNNFYKTKVEAPITVDQSDLPAVYYAVVPIFGEKSTGAEGETIISGNEIKLSGHLLLEEPEDANLLFDPPSNMVPVEILKCKITFQDLIIDNISLEDIEKGSVRINLSGLDISLFPSELKYLIKYISCNK